MYYGHSGHSATLPDTIDNLIPTERLGESRAGRLTVKKVKCRALRYQSKMSSSSKLEVALFSPKSSNHICIEPEIVGWSIVIMDAVNGQGSLNFAWSMNLYWVWILCSLHGWGCIVLPDWLQCELYLCCCAPGWITCPRHPYEQTYANMHTNTSTHTQNDTFPLMKQWARSGFTRWISMSTTV